MKILAVHPSPLMYTKIYLRLEPLGLELVAQAVRQAGHEIRLIDLQVESHRDYFKLLQNWRPDVVAFSCNYLANVPEIVDLAKLTKSMLPESFVFVGGHSASFIADRFLEHGEGAIDCILKGEGEAVVPELLQAIEHDRTAIARVPGVVSPFGSGPAPRFVETLAAISPARDLLRHRKKYFIGVLDPCASIEFARGCPWACTFCNKTLFRNKFRERDVDAVLAEVDALVARGVDYIYFIDEIFGVGKQVRVLLEEIARRPLAIGFQSRIDLWDEDTLELLGRAHCVSFECGIESITEEGREDLNKNCKYSTDRIETLLIEARKHIPWVQANLIETTKDEPTEVERFQNRLKANGVWVSEPVPMFPFPGSPQYIQTFGSEPDDNAWERAHEFYLRLFGEHGFSDIQEQHPKSLAELECAC